MSDIHRQYISATEVYDSDPARAARVRTLKRGKSTDIVVVTDDPCVNFETIADSVAIFKREMRQ